MTQVGKIELDKFGALAVYGLLASFLAMNLITFITTFTIELENLFKAFPTLFPAYNLLIMLINSFVIEILNILILVIMTASAICLVFYFGVQVKDKLMSD